ncbi:inner membrane protein YpjD [Thalassomonas sp. M1454]|uniref:cytochrome C assembly family protein n=1 Tax=Thalassomonas sp. M1454 TaxID=2594477 RepID=UPI00117EBB68|nr:cytochrome c biogenesis protein CcsA [Thalassomonas sp. M1454]TRX57473.1 cytochrome C assembly family protein [Thalassomonas sp. M1454]
MSVVLLLSLAVVASYAFAALSVFSKLFHPEGPNPKLYLSLGSLAIVLHSLLLSQSIFFQNSVDLSLMNVISLVAFIISVSITLIAIRFKANLILPVVYGFAALIQLTILLFPEHTHLAIDAGQFSLVLHISLALMSYAILVIATLYALQVSYINLKLKTKNLAAVNHLPPLLQVESQLFSIMLAGTLCLIISQIVGFAFVDGFLASENIHKTVLSLLALALYIIILLGHYRLGWRGHKVLLLSLTATAVLTLSYFGSRFVKEFLLS